MSMTGKGRRIYCVLCFASLFRRAMSAGVLVLVTLGVDAGEVPSAPMLRIETGHHTSFIQSLAYDESRQRLITVSDGKYLALGLLGRQGLHVLQTGDYSEIAWDIDYQDKTIGLLYTPQGGIITTSLDGYVRLYDKDFRLIGRVQAGLAGARPYGARLSPDGTRIAIGFHDVAAISVLSAQDLSPLYSVRVEGLEHQGNLTTVAWSAVVLVFFAVGVGGARLSLFFRIGDQGRGRVERIAAAEARVS